MSQTAFINEENSSTDIFRNVQISKMFGVSEPTVINWIKAAQESKNQLEIVEHRGKWSIVNSAHNLSEMQLLSEKGRKYRNKVPTKKIDISQLGQMRPDHTLEFLYYLEHLQRIPHKFNFLARNTEELDRLYSPDIALDTKFLQDKLLVQDSQLTWSGHLRRDAVVNIIASSYSSPYVYKSYLQDVCQKRHVQQFRFIGMREEEVKIFRKQMQPYLEKTIPTLRFQTHIGDLDADPMWSAFQKARDQVNMVLLLGEAFYDIGFFVKTVRNINRTLTPGDFIVTNISLNNPTYHTDFDAFTTDSSLMSVRNVLSQLNLEIGEDFEFEHQYEGIDPTKKWYARTGSKLWYLLTTKEIHFHYSFDGLQKNFIWPKFARIQLANYKLWQEDFSLEAAKLGYNMVSWNTNMEQTEAMVLMQKVAEGTY